MTVHTPLLFLPAGTYSIQGVQQCTKPGITLYFVRTSKFQNSHIRLEKKKTLSDASLAASDPLSTSLNSLSQHLRLPADPGLSDVRVTAPTAQQPLSPGRRRCSDRLYLAKLKSELVAGSDASERRVLLRCLGNPRAFLGTPFWIPGPYIPRESVNRPGTSRYPFV